MLPLFLLMIFLVLRKESAPVLTLVQWFIFQIHFKNGKIANLDTKTVEVACRYYEIDSRYGVMHRPLSILIV